MCCDSRHYADVRACTQDEIERMKMENMHLNMQTKQAEVLTNLDGCLQNPLDPTMINCLLVPLFGAKLEFCCHCRSGVIDG